MLLTLTTIALALAVRLGHASPLAPLTSVTSDETPFPITVLDVNAAKTNLTLGSAELHADAGQATTPATLQLCADLNCTPSSCQQINLATTIASVCLGAPIQFNSVALDVPSGESLSFEVFVGPKNCPSLTAIPTVNQCHNIVGGPFAVFSIT